MGPESAAESVSTMNKLVSEVTKDDFEVEVVKAYMEELGIPFSDDPIERLNNILKSIHFQEDKHE